MGLHAADFRRRDRIPSFPIAFAPGEATAIYCPESQSLTGQSSFTISFPRNGARASPHAVGLRRIEVWSGMCWRCWHSSAHEVLAVHAQEAETSAVGLACSTARSTPDHHRRRAHRCSARTCRFSFLRTPLSGSPARLASCRRNRRNRTISFRSKIAGESAIPPGTVMATATRSPMTTLSAWAAGSIPTTKTYSRVIIRSSASIRFSISRPRPTLTSRGGRCPRRRRRSRAPSARSRATSSAGPTASSRSISSRSRSTCFTAMPPSSRLTGASS